MPRYRPDDWKHEPDWWLIVALLLPIVVGAWTVVAVWVGQRGQP